MGRLYLVATPIGNMEDMTFRAVSVLKNVGLIAAEDTRHTGKLLRHFGIEKPITSYFEHNEKKKGPELIEAIKGGTDVALVTDAGTPGISDPGYRLVKQAIEDAIEVIAIPGASAMTAALSISGLPTDRFTFLGFLPSTKGKRRKSLLQLKNTATTYVIFESPGRLKKTLYDVYDALGDVYMVIAREMTKLHEEVLRGSVSELTEKLESRKIKGELTLILRTQGRPAANIDEAIARVEEMMGKGQSLSEAVRASAIESGLSRGELYREALRRFKE